MRGFKIGRLADVVEESGAEKAEVYIDFLDGTPRIYSKTQVPNVPVFYRVLEVFHMDKPLGKTVVAVMINGWSIGQIFNNGYWRITMERYSKDNKDVLDIVSREDEETFKVSKYTTTYDGIAKIEQYRYETDDPEIVAQEIRRAVEEGFELVFPDEFIFTL